MEYGILSVLTVQHGDNYAASKILFKLAVKLIADASRVVDYNGRVRLGRVTMGPYSKADFLYVIADCFFIELFFFFFNHNKRNVLFHWTPA